MIKSGIFYCIKVLKKFSNNNCFLQSHELLVFYWGHQSKVHRQKWVSTNRQLIVANLIYITLNILIIADHFWKLWTLTIWTFLKFLNILLNSNHSWKFYALLKLLIILMNYEHSLNLKTFFKFFEYSWNFWTFLKVLKILRNSKDSSKFSKFLKVLNILKVEENSKIS